MLFSLALLIFTQCIFVAFDGLHADNTGTGLSKATLECFAYIICNPSVHQIVQELVDWAISMCASRCSSHPQVCILFSSGCSGCKAHPDIKLIHRARHSIELLKETHDHASIDDQRKSCEMTDSQFWASSITGVDSAEHVEILWTMTKPRQCCILQFVAATVMNCHILLL